MIYYLYHAESESLFTAESLDEKNVCCGEGCDELTEDEYKQILKEQDMSVVDFGGTNQQAGDDFTELGAKPIPAEGWGTFVIIDSKTNNGNLIYTAQNNRKEECGIFLGFAGTEQWQKDQALAATLQWPTLLNFTGCSLISRSSTGRAKKKGKYGIMASRRLLYSNIHSCKNMNSIIME